jgi:hypothetical protein
MRIDLRIGRAAVLALVVLAALPVVANAQNAAEWMSRAMAAQAERLAGVENVTIVQDMMGMEMTMYMEKRDADGTPILIPVSVTMAGMTNPIPQDMAQADWSNPFQQEWVDRTRLVGTEQLDGHTVRVFAIDDFSGLELPGVPQGAEGAKDFRPTSFRYSLDEKELVMRKVEMEGEALQEDGSRSPVRLTMFMEDYREVDGYLHPFVTRTTTEGVLEAADIDREELQAQLEGMRAQLDNMPEAQRAMVEGMLKPQIEQLEGMLGGGGAMEMTITVKNLEVNAGPPGGRN